jgi:hypothetical protein
MNVLEGILRLLWADIKLKKIKKRGKYWFFELKNTYVYIGTRKKNDGL